MIKKFQAAGLALLAVALVAGCASPRGPELSKALESISETQDDLGEKAREGVGVDKKPVAAKAFSCEPLDEGVKTRGYVLLMGVPDHYLEQWDNEKELMLRDPKAVFAVVWDQDETRHIEDLSEWFLGELHALLAQKPVDELVIFGPSAGGVTSSYSIAKLDFTGKVALHTMASPTKGFDLTGFRSQFLGDRTGFIKDIAVGFQPFTKPGDNVKVYHHKTTYDADLMSNCGSLQAFCDTLDVQGNDLPGSNVFYYPEHTHATIMPAVVRTVLKCYNPALPEEEVAFDESAGLGELCYTEDECKAHCQNNRGRCIQYCDAHPENALCGKLRAYWDEVSRGEVGEPSQGPAPEPKKETLPVLQGLGFNIDAWNKNTNLAGDFIFSKKLLFDDGRVKNEKALVEFGHEGSYVEMWFHVPLGTKARAPVSGKAQVVFFEHTQDYGVNFFIPNSEWIVSFEHVVNVPVKDGDLVNAGDVVGEAAPRDTFNDEIAMTELAVWKGGREIIKTCPFTWLDESLKPEYKEKIERLAREWEEFIGRDAYQQEDWVAPGCLLLEIKEK